MRVAINGCFWNKPQTGSGQYLRELVAALARCAPDDEYRIIVPEKNRDHGSTGMLRDEPVSVNPALGFVGENIGKTWFEQVTFPRSCQRERVSLAHVPYFAAPLAHPVRTVVTIHDLIPLVLPLYRGSASVRLYTRLVSASARRAQFIIADSKCSKRDIVQQLGIAEKRIEVVYLAANERFHPVAEPARVRAKYGLGERFILYLGGYDQRKNVRILIQAFALLNDLHGKGYRLVFAGANPDVDSSFFPDPRRMAREAGLAEESVQFIGPVAEEDKPAVYSSAAVFAFPSLYEGFGLPVLEAMACGTPVVCSNTSSLPEIVGDAGLTLDPSNPRLWVEAIRTVVSDPARRAEMRGRGLEQATEFSWERTARKTHQVYERAVLA